MSGILEQIRETYSRNMLKVFFEKFSSLSEDEINTLFEFYCSDFFFELKPLFSTFRKNQLTLLEAAGFLKKFKFTAGNVTKVYWFKKELEC